MGEFRKNLQEKINSRKEKTGEELLPQEKLQKESQNLQNALVFLEKAAGEAKEGWYIDSCKELVGQGLKGKLGVFRKKMQRKSLHWYLEPVCDDQSVYNQKIQRALTAMEDFAKAQMAWNRVIEGKYEAEEKMLKMQLSEMEKKLSEMERHLAEGGERLADMENWLGRGRE